MNRSARGRKGERCAPRGAVLLEAIAALALVGIACVSLLELTLQTTSAATTSRDRSKMVIDANAFLESVSLWPRGDLDRHLGQRHEGKFAMRVERLTPTLYQVAILSNTSVAARAAVLVETTLYREVP